MVSGFMCLYCMCVVYGECVVWCVWSVWCVFTHEQVVGYVFMEVVVNILHKNTTATPHTNSPPHKHPPIHTHQ